MAIEYSVIIPLKNEEDNIRDLVDELEPVMEGLGNPWELICIDDGSTDGTRALLEQLAKKKKYLRLIVFKKNFGQSSAFDAGFKAAKGTYVITLDGDRQNDPKDIPGMLKLIDTCDMVCGRRVHRQDPSLKKVISRLANALRSRLCQDGIHDTGCSLKIYRSSCLKQIKMFDGMHRFLPALFIIEGFRVRETPVNHRERTQGKTKYNLFNRSFNTLSDLLAVVWMRKRRLRYRLEQERP